MLGKDWEKWQEKEGFPPEFLYEASDCAHPVGLRQVRNGMLADAAGH
jgi:hypothetical protein